MRVWIIVGIGLAAIVTVLFLPPIPQDPAYHDFADRRPFLGIPNALNVLSNAPFVLVQFFPLVATPLILLLFPPRYTRGADLLGALAWYALAKLFEALDARFFAVGGIVSGHTLKHLASAVAMYWILRMVRPRRAIRW